MDRTRVPGAQSGDPTRKRAGRRSRGLAPQDRDGYWHVYGTLVAQGRAIRVRQSTGLPARDDLYQAAWDETRRIEREILAELSGEGGPGDFVAVAAERYLSRPRSRPLGASTTRIVQEIVVRFGLLRFNEIPTADWSTWVDERQAGNNAATRERFINSVAAFLSWAQRNAKLKTLPTFERDKQARNPNRRARRRIGDLRPELIARLFDAAHIALKAQLAVEWSTGARVSSVLHGCRICDLIIAPGRSSLTFIETKNGRDVVAHLHPRAVAILEDYLEWRGDLHDREAPLFLTPSRQPYTDNGRAWGTQNKTAFNGAKRRAIRALRQDAAAEARDLWRKGQRKPARTVVSQAKADAALLAKVTQHWFRHLLATELLRHADLRTTMEQGGWLDPRSVMGYAHDVGEHRRKAVEGLSDFDPVAAAKTGRRS